jgi:hypothetical protein
VVDAKVLKVLSTTKVLLSGHGAREAQGSHASRNPLELLASLVRLREFKRDLKRRELKDHVLRCAAAVRTESPTL